MELTKTKVKVVEVINGDTFRVAPSWKSDRQEAGDTVKFMREGISETGTDEAKTTLEGIILGKEVELINPMDATEGHLVCNVKVEGKDITTLLKR